MPKAPMTTRATVTLRCQACDNKLAPARGFLTFQRVRRNCKECDTDYEVSIQPYRVEHKDRAGNVQRGTNFHVAYRAVSA